MRRVPRDGSWHHTHASSWEPSPSTSATTSFPHLLPIPTLPIPRPASQLPRAKPQPPTQVPPEKPHPPAQTAFQHVMFSQTPCSRVEGWLQCPRCPRTAGRLVGVGLLGRASSRSAGGGPTSGCSIILCSLHTLPAAPVQSYPHEAHLRASGSRRGCKLG